MLRIKGSVGQGGANRKEDVRAVQASLNRHDLTPLATLSTDGRSGPMTIRAIRHFQTRRLQISSPDGRVDPGGRTLRALHTAPTARGTGESTETRQADRALRRDRVDPRVQETGITTRIIDQLLPHLSPIRAKIIGGFLSDSDQFWKVNYHWEYLLGMVDHAITLPITESARKELQAIRSSLLSCPPEPARGYTSSPIGRPEDRTSPEQTMSRYTRVRASKEAFSSLNRRAGLAAMSQRSRTMFDLAAAPVAPPGRSKHGSGYALDIQGDNSAIKSLCSARGATLVFDEQSHVHVEFKNGVST